LNALENIQPAPEPVDARRLTEILVQKGVLTVQEQAQLLQHQVPTSSGNGRERVREPSVASG
jgi:hypothetical protein